MEIAVSLLTIILSAISAGLATYRLNICKERLSFRAKKAEEAYCAAEMVESQLTSFFESRYSLFGNLPQPVSEDIEIIGHVFVKLKMLVGFYFPALWTPFLRASSAAATSYRSLKAFEEATDRDEQQRQARELDATVAELKDALDALKNAILAEGCEEQALRPFPLFRRPARSMNARRVLAVPA